jgi:hypothetical protein
VVLDPEKRIIHAVAGDYIQAHRKGCEILDALGKITIRSWLTWSWYQLEDSPRISTFIRHKKPWTMLSARYAPVE